jgi:hypothetical protein
MSHIILLDASLLDASLLHREVKPRSLLSLGLHPDAAAMLLDDPLADG